METYDYHKRIQCESWLFAHIEILISEAKSEFSTSSVLYAAFEMRNLIEKVCYDLMLMSAGESEWKEIEASAAGKQGIRRSNNKYKTLKYKFQTFSEAIARLADLPVKTFDYNKAQQLEDELGKYVHTYTRTQEEMNYSSEFIQSGIEKVEESLEFIKEYFVVENGEFVYGVLNFSTLTEKYKTEFENWINSSSSDTDSLYTRLEEISKIDPFVN